jgi:DNA-binding NtrC family response regulator
MVFGRVSYQVMSLRATAPVPWPPASRPSLLVVDDEVPVLRLIERFAQKAGFDVLTCSNGTDALALLGRKPADLAMIDLRMPDVNGLDLLRQIRRAVPACEVILMTGHASVESAVDAIKLGAREFLTKPFDFERLRRVLADIREELSRRAQVTALESAVARQLEFCGMLGRSPVMQEVFSLIQRLAPHAKVVLIGGETGTGKELAARAFHHAGTRRGKPFVTINCSAVVDTLFESELFGHQRGAFTGATETKIGVFEHADGGTLFLDEVGELPSTVQPKLLRAVEYGDVQRVGSLETKRVDVRVIAATNRDLRTEGAAGRFRSDLYYRLSIMEIALAPLRERREDIPLLTAAFVRECAGRLNRQFTGVTTAAERALQEATWPGNIRELRNVIERACLLADSRIISEREIQTAMAASSRPSFAPRPAAPPLADALADSRYAGASAIPENGQLLSTAQRAQIDRVLKLSGGNKTEAARLLGISRRSLYRWIDRLALEQPRRHA